MKEIDEYLSKVKFCLIGISGKEKEKILAELKADITELANEKGFEKAIEEFGNPNALAMKYKRIYGYSTEFKVIFILTGAILSFFTVPFELRMIFVSTAILVIIFAYLVYISVNVGSNIGLMTGIFSAVVRIFALFLMPFTIDLIDIAIFVGVSIIMVVVGFLPGYSIKVKEESEEI